MSTNGRKPIVDKLFTIQPSLDHTVRSDTPTEVRQTHYPATVKFPDAGIGQFRFDAPGVNTEARYEQTVGCVEFDAVQECA